jgi:hypothetical protein
MSRIHWLLAGPRQTASSRIHGYRVHEILRRRGWDSNILFSPGAWIWDLPFAAEDLVRRARLDSEDVVIFQKINGARTVSALRSLNSWDLKTVFVDCDLPLKLQEARLASITVCSSRYLAEEYRRNGIDRAIYIPDAYEVWHLPPEPRPGQTRFRCVWFGFATADKWIELEEFRKTVLTGLENWTLIRISNHPDAEERWNLATAWDTIRRCDAAVIPASHHPASWAKSANRVVQAMAVGVAVAASPIPAYCEVIRDGRNGFLCHSTAEWKSALRLLENPAVRRRLSRLSNRAVRSAFSIERVGSLWEDVLVDLCGGDTHDCVPLAHALQD